VLVWFGAAAAFANWHLGPQLELRISWLILACVTLSYLVALFGAGAAIVWWTRSPLVGVSITSGAWVILALLGPQLLVAIASLQSDLPSRFALEQEQRERYADQTGEADNTLANRLAHAASGEPVGKASDLAAERAYPALEPEYLAARAAARSVAEATENSWTSTLRSADASLRAIARLTHGTLLPEVLAEIGHVGWRTASTWEEAVSEHKRQLNRALYDDRPIVNLFLPLGGGSVSWFYPRHAAIPHARLPQFEPPSPPPPSAATRLDFIALFLHALVALLVAGFARLRALRRRA
jgi:hypothetical protein